MSKPKVYIDGQAGTTGLQIYERLQDRDDIELLSIEEEKRHDTTERKKLINAADLVFLCLPDEAAKEAVSLIENENVKVIDASTAHRTDPNWTYGMPELSKEQEEAIKNSKRVANPGCHASGFISIVYPLIKSGLVSPDTLLNAFSLTGYTGGGKKMIADYEDNHQTFHDAPRIYGLNLNHKHIPEMMKVTGLSQKPVFSPIVANFPQGMATSIGLDKCQVNEGEFNLEKIKELYTNWYDKNGVIHFNEKSSDPMIASNHLAGKDSLEILVNGNDEQALITAVFDNLGKGACGAAIENMNLMLGLEKCAGLHL